MSFKNSQIYIIVFLLAICYFPFANKALHMDSDMLFHTAHQILLNPIDPPLGEYGRHMVLHDFTRMPHNSVYYRCGHPPLLAYFVAGIMMIWGDEEWKLHCALFPFYVLAVFTVWYLLGMYFSSEYRFFATLLWALSPALLVSGQNIMWDVPIASLMLLSLTLFLLSLRKNSSYLIVFSGIVAGLAALTKVNALPLYLLICPYLLYKREWKKLLLWCVPAISLPMIWVVHNIIIYKKIQYISIGWFGFRSGDIRYRIERFLSYSGGAIFFPVFWIWIMIARKHFRSFLICLTASFIWGILLVIVLKKPVWVGVTYGLFTTAGLWCAFRLCLYWKFYKENIFKNEPFIIGFFSILYALILVILPSASVRYMLPILPLLLFVAGKEIESWKPLNRRIFLITCTIVTMTSSLSLAYADYLLCKADQVLPSTLSQKGYDCKNTWYYGRLSFDYYLYKAGYKNLRIEKDGPAKGDFLIEEIIPGDYKPTTMLPAGLTPVPIDTVKLFRWPLKTIGNHAGFYGDDRLPYSFDFSLWQKIYCVYRLK